MPTKSRIAIVGLVSLAFSSWTAAAELQVPGQFGTIQEAINSAEDGDTVLVAPGVYHEALRIENKSITLASHFLTTQDPSCIRRTILDGSLPDPDLEDDIDPVLDEVIYVDATAGPETTITGFTIRDGDDGIACHARIQITHNRFVNNVDGIDYEGGGGQCRANEFVANDDDGVDLDLDCAVLVEENEIRDNDDDGIEIRLHDYRGEKLPIVIRNNRITGNGEDGIQIIDYPGLSDRGIRIEGNLIASNCMAGIGMMSDGNTRENYEAASVPEPIEIINNTIAESEYGLSGGSSATVFNNVFTRNRHAGVKKVNGRSRLTHNLFWQNGTDNVDSNVVEATMIRIDPQLNDTLQTAASGPCRSGGISSVEGADGEVVSASAEFQSGPETRLGASR